MKIFFFLFLFSIPTLSGQKIVKKSILNQDITTIQIDASNCYSIEIKTKPVKEILVEAKLDGEYSNDLVVNIKEEDTIINIETGFQPIFINPNDKLSAHKVVSIALDISMPQYKNVKLYGTNTRVTAKGSYENLTVILSDGTCEIINVLQDVQIRTQSGDILLNAISGDVYAKSKYGIVNHNPIPKGLTTYNLNTITGNIILNKIE